MLEGAEKDFLKKVTDAHGGLDFWSSLGSLEVEMSAGGFLFRAKEVAPLVHARMTVNTRHPEVIAHDWPSVGRSARFHGEESIEIRDSAGQVLEERRNPRSFFQGPQRLMHWDDLDFAFFSGYALWNYLTMPFLFLQEGLEVKLGEADGQEGCVKLAVRFPKGFPTHSERQEFTFDRQGFLLSHDYTAEVVGKWAKAVHFSSGYRQFGGLSLPTTRRVYPKLFGRIQLPFPLLVAIDIHNVVPVKA